MNEEFKALLAIKVKQRDELVDEYQAMTVKLAQNIKSTLDDITKNKDLPEIVVPYCSIERVWTKNDEILYECNATVGFYNPDKPNRQTDFGSDFDLKIGYYGIKINKGTCGTYSRNDIYQVGRDKLLGVMWDYESALVDAVVSSLNSELYIAVHKLNSEIGDIERTIKNNELEEEQNRILNELKSSQYFYNVVRQYNFDTHEYDYRLGACHKIVKLTDKSVLYYEVNDKGELYYPDETTHRIKLLDIIHDVKYKNIVLTKEAGHHRDPVDK